MRLLDDAERLRDAHRERTAAERDALEQQLRDQGGIIEECGRKLKALGGKEEYLKGELKPIQENLFTVMIDESNTILHGSNLAPLLFADSLVSAGHCNQRNGSSKL